MKSNRKILAQRKFAQNEKREMVPATPVVQHQPIHNTSSSILHSTQVGMSATRWLDHVSLHNIHGHTLPEAVVILERCDFVASETTPTTSSPNVHERRKSLRLLAQKRPAVAKKTTASKRKRTDSGSYNSDEPLNRLAERRSSTSMETLRFDDDNEESSNASGFYDRHKICEWITRGSQDDESDNVPLVRLPELGTQRDLGADYDTSVEVKIEEEEYIVLEEMPDIGLKMVPEMKVKMEVEPEPESELEPVLEPVPELEPISKPAPVPELESILDPTPVPELEPISEPEPVPKLEPVPERKPVPELEPISEPVPEPAPELESISKPISEPVLELEPVPELEPISEPEPLPELEPMSEPAPVPELEPISEAEPLPVLEPISEPAPIPELGPISEPAPVPELEPISEAEPLPVLEPISESALIPELGPISEPAPVPELEPISEPAPLPVLEPIPEPEPVTELEPEPVPEVEPEPVPQPEPVPEVEPEPVPQPEPAPEAEPEPVPQPEAEPEPVPTRDVYDFVEENPPNVTPSTSYSSRVRNPFSRHRKVYAQLNRYAAIECYANNGIPHVKVVPSSAVRQELLGQPDFQLIINDSLESYFSRRASRMANMSTSSVASTSGVSSRSGSYSSSGSSDMPDSTQPGPDSTRPTSQSQNSVVDAPVFRPTAKEFANPIKYIEKITPLAAPYGLCKIQPPAEFEPTCHIQDNMKFAPSCQYPAKMFNRWGPCTREFCAIRAHLLTQNIMQKRPKLLGMEIDLPKLFHIVQNKGGLEQVLKRKKFSQIAEEMNYHNVTCAPGKLERAYTKFLVPYDTMTHCERQALLAKCEREWQNYHKSALRRAENPLAKRHMLLRGAEPDDDDEEEVDTYIQRALAEAEECVNVDFDIDYPKFQKIAKHAMSLYFGRGVQPTIDQIEDEYWRLVLLGNAHVTVFTAAIDTGEDQLGFTRCPTEALGTHPWNLKRLGTNSDSVLSSLGSVLSVTTPTFHLGMVFSTSCWHQDPHGLPWIEYHHQGAPKIWYGVGECSAGRFRSAVTSLCPSVVQNKTIWLPSDVVTIPPRLLTERQVPLSKLTQAPGEFVVVFPRAYTTSICTGLTLSESVYFANHNWLHTSRNDFLEAKLSCEPTMFALEQLLIMMVKDQRVDTALLPIVHRHLETIIYDELTYRRQLANSGLQLRVEELPEQEPHASWNQLDECDVCCSALYLSKVISLTSPGSVVCPQHGLEMIEKQTVTATEAKRGLIIAHFTELQLTNIKRTLEERIFACTTISTRASQR